MHTPERYRVVSVSIMDPPVNSYDFPDGPATVYHVEDTSVDDGADYIVASYSVELRAIGHAARLNYLDRRTSDSTGEPNG